LNFISIWKIREYFTKHNLLWNTLYGLQHVAVNMGWLIGLHEQKMQVTTNDYYVLHRVQHNFAACYNLICALVRTRDHWLRDRLFMAPLHHAGIWDLYSLLLFGPYFLQGLPTNLVQMQNIRSFMTVLFNLIFSKLWTPMQIILS
jgi:hypothetical protein